MPCLQTMEYLGRLGLVPRKNKKERSLPSHVAYSRETKRSTAEESSRTCTPRRPIFDTAPCTERATKELKNAHTRQTTDTAEAFFPRTSTSGQEALIDIEFLEYEHHVQSRAKALSSHTFHGAPGGRHAWKTLIFWKRRRALAPPACSAYLSAAAPTPVPAGPRSQRRRQAMSCPATVPLYMSEELASSSIRAWWEPGMRVDATESCNRSPYVALGARSQRLPAPSTTPLYLV